MFVRLCTTFVRRNPLVVFIYKGEFPFLDEFDYCTKGKSLFGVNLITVQRESPREEICSFPKITQLHNAVSDNEWTIDIERIRVRYGATCQTREKRYFRLKSWAKYTISRRKFFQRKQTVYYMFGFEHISACQRCPQNLGSCWWLSPWTETYRKHIW